MHHRGRPEIEIPTIPPATTHRDLGWNLVEVLLVVLILGTLAAGVGFALSSMRSASADSDCGIDQHHDPYANGGTAPDRSSPC